VIGCWWIEEKNNVMTNPVMRYLGWKLINHR
jgi:hypothetical protein